MSKIGKMVNPEIIYFCKSQMQRNTKLVTYKPCNNCLFYAWDFVRNCYTCHSDLGQVEKVGADSEQNN